MAPSPSSKAKSISWDTPVKKPVKLARIKFTCNEPEPTWTTMTSGRKLWAARRNIRSKTCVNMASSTPSLSGRFTAWNRPRPNPMSCTPPVPGKKPGSCRWMDRVSTRRVKENAWRKVIYNTRSKQYFDRYWYRTEINVSFYLWLRWKIPVLQQQREF